LAFWQFTRFVLVGLLGTLGNLAAVWAIRSVAPFSVALLGGIVAGFCISFACNKVFTFRSMSWSAAKAEAVRFGLVYGIGASFYWLFAMLTANYVFIHYFEPATAERLGTLVGIGAMTVVTYSGHSLFTFRSTAGTSAAQPGRPELPADVAEPAVQGDEAERCLSCSGRNLRVLYPATFSGSAVDAAPYFLSARERTAHGRICKCDDCDFVFTHPRFTAEEYDAIYARIKWPDTLEPSMLAAKEARFRRLARIIRRYVPEPVPFLDLGCGDGTFLRCFDDPLGQGFEVDAPGEWMAGRSRVITGQWTDVVRENKFKTDQFGFVVAFDVMEHLSRPDEDLSLIRQVLRPGGLLFATMPDVSSVVARAMGKRWNMLLLEHLWYFSPKTLAPVLARNGFSIVSVRTVPFDAPAIQMVTKLADTFGLERPKTLGALAQIVVPAPAGMMLVIARAI
jgi:putative flippase GtrA/SAM-dependent methyltransferase